MNKLKFLFFIVFFFTITFKANSLMNMNGSTKTVIDRWIEFDNETNVTYQLNLNFNINYQNRFKVYFNLMNENYYTQDLYGTSYNKPSSHQSYLSNAQINVRQEFSKMGFESKLFYRGGGNYWLDGSMLELLDIDKVKDDDNGRGTRFDLWFSDKISLKYVFSDRSGYSGNDLHLLRARADFFKKHFILGAFYFRENDISGFTDDYKHLIATDFRISLFKYTLSFEAATYDDMTNKEIVKYNKNAWNKPLSNIIKANVAFKFQLEGLKIGNYKWGYISFFPGVWSYGDTYNSHFDNDDIANNQLGYWINAKYIVPKRAITFTLDWNEKKLYIPMQIGDKEFNKSDNKFYSEAYIEFINGFKYKLYYERRNEYRKKKLFDNTGVFLGFTQKRFSANDFFNELSVENFLGKIRTQYLIRDVGRDTQKNQFGIEFSFNINEKTRFFYRGLYSDEQTILKKIFFAEISYRITSNSTIYFQYGPYGIGDNNLIFDGDFDYFNYTNTLYDQEISDESIYDVSFHKEQAYIQRYFRMSWEVGF
ncbi:MAG: hypothetical protein K8S23_02400 [Candidatus Cloacimonetes bacterium]|nr:hypothetical protein [Candidatus Cloacimonadota bacterium]